MERFASTDRPDVTDADPDDGPIPPPPDRWRAPLGLPRGSVRALVALLVVAVVIAEVLRGRPLSLLLAETLLVVLAHYFATRRLLALAPRQLRHLEREGVLEAEPHPLWLPRHTIRVLIVLAFASLVAYLAWEGRLFGSPALWTLVTVTAYLLGLLIRVLFHWWAGRQGRPKKSPRWWVDGKATAVVLATVLLAVAFLTNRPDLLPDWWQKSTFGLILFYFGSR